MTRIKSLVALKKDSPAKDSLTLNSVKVFESFRVSDN